MKLATPIGASASWKVQVIVPRSVSTTARSGPGPSGRSMSAWPSVNMPFSGSVVSGSTSSGAGPSGPQPPLPVEPPVLELLVALELASVDDAVELELELALETLADVLAPLPALDPDPDVATEEPQPSARTEP